jgi:diguanylate cyclase (GGDEF)-like protein
MDVTKAQQEYLDSSREDFEQIKYKAFIDMIASFQNKILEELVNADKRIVYLENRLQEVLVDSMLDPLTKAYNRKALEKDMDVYLDYRRKTPLTLMIIDGDDFKKINDKYGHLIGDKILVFLVNTVKHNLKNLGKVYRYGGEEFIVLFDGFDIEESYKISESIRAKIESSRLIYTDETIKFTISIGMTEYIANDTFETIVDRADKNLYIAKESGKNKIIKGK